MKTEHAPLARCVNPAPSRFGLTASTDLAGRGTAATAAPEVETYAAGSTVYITCQAIGANAYGSNIWDYTVDKLWVADHYLKTGYDTFTPGIPRCAGESTAGGEYPAKVAVARRKAKSITAARRRARRPSGSPE